MYIHMSEQKTNVRSVSKVQEMSPDLSESQTRIQTLPFHAREAGQPLLSADSDLGLTVIPIREQRRTRPPQRLTLVLVQMNIRRFKLEDPHQDGLDGSIALQPPVPPATGHKGLEDSAKPPAWGHSPVGEEMLKACPCSEPDATRTGASEPSPKGRRRPSSHAGAFVDSRSGLDLGYWLCLREGIRAKQPVDLKNVVYVLKNLNGREKLTKSIQYACRALWYYTSTYRPESDLGPRFERLFRAAQTARMCTHLFRTIEEVEDLIAAYHDKDRPGWRRSVQAIRAVANALYWVWDNMCFLNRIKFIEIDCDTAAYRSDVAWAVDCAFGVLVALVDLAQHHKHRLSLRQRLLALETRGPLPSHPQSHSQAPPPPPPLPPAPQKADNSGGLRRRKTGGKATGPEDEKEEGQAHDENNGHAHAHAQGASSANGRATVTPSSNGPPAQEQGPLVRSENEGEEEEEALRREVRAAEERQFVLLTNLIGPACDYLVASNGVTYLRLTKKLHNGGMGLAGLTSALMGMYKVYPSVH